MLSLNQPSIVILSKNQTSQEDLDILTTYISSGTNYKPLVVGSSKVVNQTSEVVSESLKQKLISSDIFNFFSPLVLLFKVFSFKKEAKKIIKGANVKGLITFDDRSVKELCYISVFQKSNIPIVFVPYGCTTKQARIYARKYMKGSNVKYKKLAWLAKLIWPKQVSDSESNFLFYSFIETLFLSLHGVLPQNPWSVGSNASVKIAFFGQFDLELARLDGYDGKNYLLTGQPVLDVLHKSNLGRDDIRKNLGDKYKIPAINDIIICSVPQLAEENLLREDEQRKSIDDLFSAMIFQKTTVLLSLHPRSKRDNYSAIAEKYGHIIIDEPLSMVLPVAKVFVSTLSSTVRWAILLAVPCVIIDVLARNYNLFKCFSSLCEVNNYSLLKIKIKELIVNNDFYSQQVSLMKQEKEGVAQFDGNSCRRIMDGLQVEH